MNQSEIALTVAQYRDAIDKLMAYQAKEPDGTKRAKAQAQIDIYSDKIIDTVWQGIVSRTEALNSLMADLKVIIARASNVPSLSGALGKLNDVVTQASEALGKDEEDQQ